MILHCYQILFPNRKDSEKNFAILVGKQNLIFGTHIETFFRYRLSASRLSHVISSYSGSINFKAGVISHFPIFFTSIKTTRNEETSKYFISFNLVANFPL